MDDEGRWDKDQQHLDDYHYDLRHEEELANCKCEDYTITDIVDIRGYERRNGAYQKMKEPMVEVELTCDFCGKTNYGDILFARVLELLNDEAWSHQASKLKLRVKDGEWS